ncbi:DNA polymerase III subunit delta' [Clostridium tarantellae]|uniref:DNA polymerase III subunit delta' n=1 Tax=Clostridium tarantellae TaxID=39493 RepID=A0A6I1MHX0_9CLOT|nr:DNA polymerase III subunit delta' [Clostridium tarantellae]
MIGHKKVIEGFYKSINRDTLSHAHLIIGEEGIGKSLLARKFAFEILGVPEQKDYVDIIHYKSNKSSFGIDTVREIISEANKKPYANDKKVIILYEGEKLTVQAQNALLKTIEEPQKGIFIIILSENGELILETIKSRCQIHRLIPLKRLEMMEFLKVNYPDLKDENLIKTLLAFAEGVPGQIEKFLKDDQFNNLRLVIINFLMELSSTSQYIALKYSDIFMSFKNKEDEIFSTIVSFVRDIIIYKELEEKSSIINGDKLEEIKQLSNMLSYKELSRIISKVDEARINLKSNTNSWSTFNTMLINILEE